MNRELYSVSRLARELGRDRRTMARDLEGLEPDQVEKRGERRHCRYYLRPVWDHLAKTGAPGGAVPGELDPAFEKARVDKERADKLAMENEQSRGELIPAGDVEAEWTRTFTDIKASFLAIPRKLAPQVVGMASLPEIEAVLMNGIRDALIRAAAPEENDADG